MMRKVSTPSSVSLEVCSSEYAEIRRNMAILNSMEPNHTYFINDDFCKTNPNTPSSPKIKNDGISLFKGTSYRIALNYLKLISSQKSPSKLYQKFNAVKNTV
uniref:Uncharacterized protein n=1 Tax=Micrurus lemniscatus lemniscatus TaxID=129467 RepID=A0A2D4HEE3_MICLE